MSSKEALIRNQNRIPNIETTNTVENPWNLFLKSLHEESVHVAAGVEFERMTNFFQATRLIHSRYTKYI